MKVGYLKVNDDYKIDPVFPQNMVNQVGMSIKGVISVNYKTIIMSSLISLEGTKIFIKKGSYPKPISPTVFTSPNENISANSGK